MGCQSSRIVIDEKLKKQEERGHQENHTKPNKKVSTVWPQNETEDKATDVQQHIYLAKAVKNRREDESIVSDRQAVVGRNDRSEPATKVVSSANTDRQTESYQRRMNYHNVCRSVQAEVATKNNFRGLVGLKNIGNTCFMNVAIQCLSNCVPLTNFFLSCEFFEDINADNPLGYHGLVANSYCKLITRMWEGSLGSYIVPYSFKSAVDSVVPHFRGYDQHDVHEYIIFLMDAIHEDLNRVNRKNINTSGRSVGSEQSGHKSVFSQPKALYDKLLKFALQSSHIFFNYKATKEPSPSLKEELIAREAWKGYLKRNKSIIVDLFQGQIRSVLKCSKCSYRSVTFDPFMYLSIPVPRTEQIVQLKWCIRHYCDEEQLSGANSWFCTKCNEYTDATKKLDLWKMPPILIIHLKRFDSGDETKSNGKIKTRVRFPLESLDLSKYVSGYQREAPDYDLFSVANHHGSLQCGHYTAYAKNRSTNKWFHFDDSNVNQVPSEEVVSSSAYVLMYARMTTLMSPDETNTASPSDASSISPLKQLSQPSVNRDTNTVNVKVRPRNKNIRTAGVIRRQSDSKPHLWPHENIEIPSELLFPENEAKK